MVFCKKKIFLITLCLLLITSYTFSFGGALASERILRAACDGDCKIDPAIGGTGYNAVLPLFNLYDPLVFPDTNGLPTPHIAESWEASSDSTLWTFYLRQGVKFHDGSELTAEDVKFSMDRLKAIGEGSAYLFEIVESTEILDKYTVSFHLKNTFAPFLSTLYSFVIVSKDIVLDNTKEGPYGSLGDYGKGYLQFNDAGSGPYMVKEFPYAEYLLMEKNPNYFLPIDSNCPDEYKLVFTIEPVTIRSLMSKRELEISDIGQSTETLLALGNTEGINIAKNYSSGGVWVYAMNTKTPPTDDIHFRKAMAWAVDYQTTVDKIFVDTIQARGPVSHETPGFDPTVFQYYRDLDNAIEELQQSKYYDKLDEYPVTLHYCAEDKDEAKMALLFVSNMADIGIKVEVTATPWVVLTEECSSLESSPNITNFYATAPYPDAGAVLQLRYSSSTAKNWEQNEWLLDSTFDKMIVDALSTPDDDERYEQYGKLQHYIVDLCPTIFLADVVIRRAYQANYIDWPLVRDEAPPVEGYDTIGRFLKVYPEKRSELLNK